MPARDRVLKDAQGQTDRDDFLAGPHAVDGSERQHRLRRLRAPATRTSARSKSCETVVHSAGQRFRPTHSRTVTETLLPHDVPIGDDRAGSGEKPAAAAFLRFNRDDGRD